MPSTTFSTPGAHTYTVPSGVQTVVLKCWGAGGGDAAASGSGLTDTTTGAAGGYAEGTYDVSPGDDLTIVVGGVGPTPSSATDDVGGGTRTGGAGQQATQTGDVASGGGGGSSEVRFPNDVVGDRVIVAPGGAGGGAVYLSNNSGTADAGAPGGGGENGSDASDGTGGGTAGGASGATGEVGDEFNGSNDVDVAIAGGGAGGGADGGGAGTLSANTISPGTATVGGSAGGAFDTSGVTSTTTTDAGGNAGDGQVVIEEPPEAPSGLSATENAGDVDLSWTDNSSDEDGFRIYRATSSGSTVGDYTEIDSVGVDVTTYTDTTATTEGEQYFYRVSAFNSIGERLSNEDSATTPLPAPTGFSIDAVSGDQFDLSWTDNATDGDGYRVYVSTDGGSTFSQDGGDLAADTTSTTTTDLLDGEEYTIEVRAFTEHVESASGTDVDTTVLPDADQPSLGNGVEDEITVDRETEISDNGDARIQLRETGETAWDGTAEGFAEQVIDHATLTATFTGLEDGEEYEVRARTETPHVTGAWTTPVSAITVLPAPSGLSSSNVTTTSLDLSWTVNSDNSTGIDVERRKDVNGTFSAWQTLATLAAGTSSYTDSTVQPNRTYEYRIEDTTEHTTATSAALSVDTGSTDVRQDRVPSSGWYVEVDHSDGSTLTPRLASDPQVDQTANGLPELEIPVPYDTKWQASAFEDATVRAYRDGQPQPVDTLVAVAVREGGGEKRTILTAEGGTELKQRVTKNVRFEDADVVARDLVDNNTSLTTNVDDPVSSTDEVLMASADFNEDWQDVLLDYPFPADSPLTVGGGFLLTDQSADIQRAEDVVTSDFDDILADIYENGAAEQSGTVGDTLEAAAGLNYDVPAGDFHATARLFYTGTTHPGFELRVEGETVVSTSADSDFFQNPDDPQWLTPSAYSQEVPDNNPVNWDFEITEAASDGSTLIVDALAFTDGRYTIQVQDDQLTDGGLLSWPNLHPDQISTETTDFQALNQIVGGRLTSTWSNTETNQAIALSNDQGSTYEITGSNTDSIDGSFSSDSGQIRAKFTLSYGSSTGSGEVINGDVQRIDLFELFADQENTPVLIDRSFDDRLVTVLQVIADDKNFLFELQVDRDYQFSFEMTQPGQRTSDRDSDVVSYDISKSTKDVIEKAVIKGGRQTRRQEDFTSDHDTLVGLAQDDLVEGTEAVYDASTGEQFTRGDDYEMDYLAGQIEVLSTGAMSDSTTYQIDYDYKPQASFTKAGVSDPKTIVRSIPSLQNEQTAEQLAQTLVTKFGSPVYEATVTIPDTVGWSVIDEVDPDKVPAAGNRLQVKALETTPEAVVGQFASRERADAFIERVRQRLGRTETRV